MNLPHITPFWHKSKPEPTPERNKTLLAMGLGHLIDGEAQDRSTVPQDHAAPAAEENMADTTAVKKQSILQHIGSILRSVLHIGEEAAQVALPVVSLAFPDIAPLYASALGLALSAETTVGSAAGTGVQKLQSITPQLLTLGQKFAADNNFTWAENEIKEWASAVVDTVNRIPAPTK